MKSIQELSTLALLVDRARRNISLEDFGKSATVTAYQSIIQFHSRSQPIELQGLLATLTQHRPVGSGALHTLDTFKQAHVNCLQKAVHLSSLLHVPSALYLTC